MDSGTGIWLEVWGALRVGGLEGNEKSDDSMF